MRVALAQLNPRVGDFAANAAAIAAAAQRAHAQGAELMVGGELGLCGYTPRDLLWDQAFLDRCHVALLALAAQVPLPCLVGAPEQSVTDGARHLFNAAFLLHRGQVTVAARKTLLPNYDVFDEPRYFTSSPAAARKPLSIAGVSVGVSICEDMWNLTAPPGHAAYDQDPLGVLVAQGAEILVNLSASPFTMSKRTSRPMLLRSQAMRLGRPLVFVNQVGAMDELLFDGASQVVTPHGQVLGRAQEFAEDLVVVDIAPVKTPLAGALAPGASHANDPPEPAGADVESLESVLLRGLTMGIADYARKTGFQRAVLGLSGGIDSALTAALAVRALGAANVLGLAMPSRHSSDHSLRDARDLARNLGMELIELSIENPFSAFLSVLEPAFRGLPEDTTEENLQARIRGVLVMALANKRGSLALTTGNKSETAVGYATLYGDMAGALAPLGDVYKTLVSRLSLELNRAAGRTIIPESTLTKPPSAELRPGQQDDDSLPPYPVLDRVLEQHIERGMSHEALIAAGEDAALVARVLKLVEKSEFKRNQAAPALKITDRAFGVGRRIPLAKV